MKRLMYVIGIGLMTGSLWAACTGPFCYDDTGASIAGFPYNGNGMGVPVVSSTTLNTITPYVGQFAICNTCTGFAKTVYVPCVSTGTAVGSFIAISTAAALSVCK